MAKANSIPNVGSLNPTLNYLMADLAPRWSQTRTVAKNGGHYTSIQDAIGSISDASASKPYTVLIAPGTYDEQIVLSDHIDLVGLDRETVEITKTSATDTLIKVSGTVSISNLTITGPSAYNTINNDANAVNLTLRHITLTSANEIIISGSSGTCTLTIEYSEIDSDIAGISGSTDNFSSVAIRHSRITGVTPLAIGSDVFELFHSEFVADGTNRNAIKIINATAPSNVKIYFCRIISTGTGYPVNSSNGISASIAHCATNGALGPNVSNDIATPYNVLDTDA